MAQGRSIERDIRPVSIGKNDRDIKDWLDSMPSHFRFSNYVKSLIRKDMKGQGQGQAIQEYSAAPLPPPTIELKGPVERKDVQLSKEELEANLRATILGS